MRALGMRYIFESCLTVKLSNDVLKLISISKFIAIVKVTTFD